MTTNFEWNEDKARVNLKKHGISFNEAKTVFADTLSLTLEDPTHSKLEVRFLTIGYSLQNRLLLVVHTERQGTIRIISARKATRGERDCMNKKTNFNVTDNEMLEDYTEKLTSTPLRKAVRGKYSRSLAANDSSAVKITGENADRYVTMKTIEVEVLVDGEGRLTVNIPSNLTSGKYRAVLIIEEPTEKYQ